MRYFNLFSNIIVTRGFNRVLFSDLQRNISELYPVELGDIIDSLEIKSIENILKGLDTHSRTLFNEYIDELLEKEYGFITSDNWELNLPKIPTTYNDYSTISNLFIEIEDVSSIHKIKNSVDNLLVKYIVIHCYKNLTIEDFIEIDNYFEKSTLIGIEIYCPFYTGVTNKFLSKINEQSKRFYNIIFFNCKKVPFKRQKDFRFAIEFTNIGIDRMSCGKINLKYFNTNISKVLESLNHNSCLHKKISIDLNGNIKNCPSMTQSFGNILFPEYKELFTLVSILSIVEIAFPVWLLIKGVTTQQPVPVNAS